MAHPSRNLTNNGALTPGRGRARPPRHAICAVLICPDKTAARTQSGPLQGKRNPARWRAPLPGAAALNRSHARVHATQYARNQHANYCSPRSRTYGTSTHRIPSVRAHAHKNESYHFPYTQAVDETVDEPADRSVGTGTIRGTTTPAPLGSVPVLHSRPGRRICLSTRPVHSKRPLTCADFVVPRIHRPYYDYWLAI